MIDTHDIRQHLAEASQFMMMPWDMDRLTRYEVFEFYVKPDEKKLGVSREMTPYRQRAFDQWMREGICKDWSECERLWQSQQQQRQQ